jgi:hypothetical protein
MKTHIPIRALVAALTFGAAWFASGTASAVDLSTHVLPIYQIGTGAQISLGHVVSARTNYNRLFAGGTYVATCAASEMLPTSGQRFLSSDALIGPRSLQVTIPTNLPARVNMPGFNATTLRGRRLDCTYNWTARAVESQYSIGAGGGGFISGGGEMSEGSTQLFSMTVPSLGDVNDGSACLP